MVLYSTMKYYGGHCIGIFRELGTWIFCRKFKLIFDLNFEIQKVELRICCESFGTTCDGFGFIWLSITVQELWFFNQILVSASFDPRQGFQSKTVSRLFSLFWVLYSARTSKSVYSRNRVDQELICTKLLTYQGRSVIAKDQ